MKCATATSLSSNMDKVLIVAIGLMFLGITGIVLFREKNEEVSSRMEVSIRDTTLSVEVADTALRQIRGLSRRPSLGEYEGMLFVYENPQILSFWMKDMYFPIDIIWIDENRTVAGIVRHVSPDTFPQTFSSLVLVQYVLEVQAGWVDRHGLVPGDPIAW